MRLRLGRRPPDRRDQRRLGLRGLGALVLHADDAVRRADHERAHDPLGRHPADLDRPDAREQHPAGDRRGRERRGDRRARPLSAALAGVHRRRALRALVEPESPAATPPTIQQFAAWTAMVAQTFPTVHEFIVMNECNQPLFLNPQWNTAGGNQSAEICGRALAAAYDALKAVSSANFVWGVGLSPRGNDAPNSPSNSSTSPVHFLEDLGTWFKAFAAQTHRDRPADGRARLPPLPDPAVAAVRERLCRPERRERHEPPAHLPGVLQRVQRLAAADDRPAGGRRACRSASTRWGSRPTRPACRATRGSR